MSIAVGLPVVECVSLLACAPYMYKRCCRTGSQDSEDWDLATPADFEPIPRICRVVLSVYEDDLTQPRWAPQGGYRMDIGCVVKRRGYNDTHGNAPSYLIYLDHNAQDIVFAIRGLNLGKEKDYAILLNNKLGKEPVDGGFVHHGLLKSARWLLNEEAETLSRLVQEYPSYTLTFAGHSLGSGVASLLTMLVAIDSSKLGNISRERVRCYGIAPARCMSLSLAIRYADIIHSVILQDDFLARTATPLEDIFKSIFCLPCLLCSRCTKDTFLSEEKMLRDPRRLYTPGRVYHIVDRKFCSCGTYPPVVRTAVPVNGRFEHVVPSCNATKDHSLVWIEKESQKAFELLIEMDKSTEVPPEQKMGRRQTFKEQHKAALKKAHTLNIPNTDSHDNGSDVSDSTESERKEDGLEKAQKQNQSNQKNAFHAHDKTEAAATQTEKPSHSDNVRTSNSAPKKGK